MVKYSIIEKFNVLLTIIKSSPFFLTCFIIGIFLLSFVVLDYKITKKVRNRFILASLILIIVFIIYKYYNYLISLSDNFVEEIFMAIYFPNLAVYSLVIVSTNICLFISLIKKQVQNEYKIANIFSTIILDFLFILILETIIKNDIDIYETLTIYSNKEMLVLIELSTAIYTAWIIVIGFIKLVDKTIGKEKVEEKLAMPIYEAPANNPYEINAEVQVPLTESADYTNVFNIDQNYIDVINVEEQNKNKKNIFALFNREKEETNDINITEEVIETTPTIENNIESIETSNISLEKEKYIKNFVSQFNDDETVIEEAVNLVENNVVIEETVELKTEKENKIKNFMSLFNREKEKTNDINITEEVIETTPMIENNIESIETSNISLEKEKYIKNFVSLFNDDETVIEEAVNLVENNVVIEETVDLSTLSKTDNNLLMQENNIQISNNEILSQQKSNEKKKFVKLFDKSLFNKKKEEEIIDYRVPLFETLNDDAIMNCIVPIQKEKIVPIVKQTINVEIDGKELLEKFNKGEKLDVEQYKILKDYIIKQGV